MEIFGQVFGHALGQGGDQHPQAKRCHLADFIQQVIDLAFHRADLDCRVDQAGGADHLFGEHPAGLFQLPFGGGGGNEDRLRPHRVPFLELQRAVVHAAWQPEAEFGKGELAPVVAFVHAADLRHRNVAFISKNNGVVGDEFKQRRRRLARRAPGKVARIVLDAGANPGGFQHFQIERAALFQALRLEQFAGVGQLIQPVPEFLFDPDDRLIEGRARGDVVAVGIDADLLEGIGLGPGQRIEFGDRLQLVAKEGKAPGAVFKVGGPDFQTVAAHPETAALKRGIVALVGLRHQFRHDGPQIIGGTHHKILGHRGIGLDGTDAVDARHRGDDDHIVAFQQGAGGRVAHPVDLLVDLGFLLDEGIRPRHVSFGLVVVVVAHEIFDRVVGKEGLEFTV